MVEYAIVKVFFGPRSKNKTYCGFARVIDKNGAYTGEEIFFRLQRARLVETQYVYARRVASYVRQAYLAFSPDRATRKDLGQMPRSGDRIVFEAPRVYSPHRKAQSWTFEHLWNDHLDGLDDADGTFGTCMRCGCNLSEEDASVGDVCYGCVPVYMEEWESEQEHLREEADENRRYPDVSDDDFVRDDDDDFR